MVIFRRHTKTIASSFDPGIVIRFYYYFYFFKVSIYIYLDQIVCMKSIKILPVYWIVTSLRSKAMKKVTAFLAQKKIALLTENCHCIAAIAHSPAHHQTGVKPLYLFEYYLIEAISLFQSLHSHISWRLRLRLLLQLLLILQ